MLQRMRDIVQGRISDKTLFLNISAAIQYEVEEATKDILGRLKGRILSNLGSLQRDISTALASENVEKPKNQDPAKTKRQEELLKSTTSLIQKHSRVIGELKL
jgi:hypothetical protein